MVEEKIGKYTLEIDTDNLISRCYTTAKSGKKKYRFRYKFNSLEHMTNYVTNEKIQIEKETRTDLKKEKVKEKAKKLIPTIYSVGDILYHSWGWEQTNIDYYQIVKVTKASVVLREIAQDKEYTHDMSGMCSPVPNEFISTETITKRIKIVIDSNYNPQFYVSMKSGWCEKWDGVAKGFSCYG